MSLARKNRKYNYFYYFSINMTIEQKYGKLVKNGAIRSGYGSERAWCKQQIANIFSLIFPV